MFTKFRLSTSVLIGFLGLFLMAMPALAQDVIKIKVGHGDTTQNPNHLSLVYFKKIIEEKSGGKIEVTIHSGSSLGSDREMLEAAQLGGIQLVNCPTGPVTPFVKELFLFDLPFMFNSYPQARAVAQSPEQKALMEPAFEAANLKLLGYYEQGFRNITNSRRAIWSVDDLKGLKIRTMEAPLHMVNFKALGASPTPMAFGELFTALQQKVVDGQENPFTVIYFEKFYEVQKYLSITNHLYDAMPLSASKIWWDSLSPDNQKMIQDAINDSVRYNYELNTKLLNSCLMKMLAVKDFQVNAVPERNLKQFKELGQAAVGAELNNRLGADMVDKWKKMVEKILAEMQ